LLVRVLVVGSHFDQATRKPFEDACEDLGHAFAAAGFDLVVGSNDLQSADRYIMQGASGSKGRRPKVTAFRPEKALLSYAVAASGLITSGN
jgi:hypothetical protein